MTETPEGPQLPPSTTSMEEPLAEASGTEVSQRRYRVRSVQERLRLKREAEYFSTPLDERRHLPHIHTEYPLLSGAMEEPDPPIIA